MEESIYDLISNLKDEEWDYRHKENRGSFQKAFIDGQSANSFIEEYFGHAGKEGMPLEKLGIEMGNFPKSEHTASIFFLGALVYHKCFPDDTYLKGKTYSGYELFPFLWFLTCLFHDFANDFEYKQKDLESLDTIEKLNGFLEIKKENQLLNKSVKQTNLALFKAISLYYQYRIDSMKKVDHGIAGGLFLYDRLVRNRNKKEDEKNAKNEKNAFWDFSLEVDYAEASATIATHNIYFNDPKVKAYFKGKKDNMLKGLAKISFKESSLLFLLGLVDTLDPLKIYQCFKSDKLILQNICLTFPEDGKMLIQVRENSPLNPQCLKDKITDLDWLDLKATEIDRGIYLTFN
ncbi:MAG: hypothetical protein JKY08_00060 [Flavobacteriaceae bacterium]|nr:hypothetical protein [Flavobacteriaceae bacterium]